MSEQTNFVIHITLSNLWGMTSNLRRCKTKEMSPKKCGIWDIFMNIYDTKMKNDMIWEKPSERKYQKEATKTVHTVDLIFILFYCTCFYFLSIFLLSFSLQPANSSSLKKTYISKAYSLHWIWFIRYIKFFQECLVFWYVLKWLLCALYYTHTFTYVRLDLM